MAYKSLWGAGCGKGTGGKPCYGTLPVVHSPRMQCPWVTDGAEQPSWGVVRYTRQEPGGGERSQTSYVVYADEWRSRLGK